MPSVIARAISASVQSPRPFALLAVMLAATETPQGPGNSMPPAPRPVANSGSPCGPRRVWHSMQWPMPTRYLPRPSGVDSSAAVAGCSKPGGGSARMIWRYSGGGTACFTGVTVRR
jgi:hypothetical protein